MFRKTSQFTLRNISVKSFKMDDQFIKVRDGLDTEERDEDVPTEEQIERMEERLEEAQGQQKNLFLIIFQVL